jgi:opacity protein-like surface antigen
MRMRQICFAAVLSVAVSGTAHAEGVRAEIHGGYDRLSYKNFFSPSDSTFGPVESGVFGFGIGYDTAISDRLFAGIEGNVDFRTGSRCQVNPLILAPGIFESCLRPGRDLSANARLGVNLGSGRTRLYALAGYSNLRLKSYGRINRAPPITIQSENRDGIRIGAGLEHSFDDRLYGKVEYRYSDYGSKINSNQGLVGVGIRF